MNTQAKDILSKEKRKELDYLFLHESSVSNKTAVSKQFIAISVVGLGFLFSIRKDLNCDIDKMILLGSACLFILAIFLITKNFDKASEYFLLRIRIIVENDLDKKQALKNKTAAPERKYKRITKFYKTFVYIAIGLCMILAVRVLF